MDRVKERDWNTEKHLGAEIILHLIWWFMEMPTFVIQVSNYNLNWQRATVTDFKQLWDRKMSKYHKNLKIDHTKPSETWFYSAVFWISPFTEKNYK